MLSCPSQLDGMLVSSGPDSEHTLHMLTLTLAFDV